MSLKSDKERKISFEEPSQRKSL